MNPWSSIFLTPVFPLLHLLFNSKCIKCLYCIYLLLVKSRCLCVNLQFSVLMHCSVNICTFVKFNCVILITQYLIYDSKYLIYDRITEYLSLNMKRLCLWELLFIDITQMIISSFLKIIHKETHAMTRRKNRCDLKQHISMYQRV